MITFEKSEQTALTSIIAILRQLLAIASIGLKVE